MHLSTIIRHGGSRLLPFNTIVLNCGSVAVNGRVRSSNSCLADPPQGSSVWVISLQGSLCRWNIQSWPIPITQAAEVFPLSRPIHPPLFFFFACGSEELISWTAVSRALSIRWTSQISLFVLEPDLNLAFPLYSFCIWTHSWRISGAPVALLTEAVMKQVSTIAKYFLRGALKKRRAPGYIINYISNVNNSTKRRH